MIVLHLARQSYLTRKASPIADTPRPKHSTTRQTFAVGEHRLRARTQALRHFGRYRQIFGARIAQTHNAIHYWLTITPWGKTKRGASKGAPGNGFCISGAMRHSTQITAILCQSVLFVKPGTESNLQTPQQRRSARREDGIEVRHEQENPPPTARVELHEHERDQNEKETPHGPPSQPSKSSNIRWMRLR